MEIWRWEMMRGARVKENGRVSDGGVGEELDGEGAGRVEASEGGR